MPIPIQDLVAAIQERAYYPAAAYAVAILISLIRTRQPLIIDALPKRVQWLPAVLISTLAAFVEAFYDDQTLPVAIGLALYAGFVSGPGAVGVQRIAKEISQGDGKNDGSGPTGGSAARLTSVSLLLLVLGLGCSAIPRTPSVDSLPVASTVVLEGRTTPTCGAVAIGPHTLVTADHCVTEDETVFWFDVDRFERNAPFGHARVVSVRNQVAELRTREPLRSWARCGSTVDGATVTAVHHGFGVYWTRMPVRVVAARWLSFVIVKPALPPVSSGTGVWNEQGELLGVVVERRDGMSYAVRC